MHSRWPARADNRRLIPLPVLLLIALLMGLVALPGCGGCWGGGTAAEAKKKKEDDEKEKRRKKLDKPKDDFEPIAVRMLPSSDPTPSLKTDNVKVKPGHWVAVNETLKANNFDFPGELATFAQHQATSVPLELEDKVSRMAIWCPAVLPKGQNKRVETLFYTPRRPVELGSVYSLRSELRGVRGGRTEAFTSTLSPSLKHYEHFIVVLAGNSVTPSAYLHFEKLHSVRMPWVEALENEPLQHYHVVRPSTDRGVPLPSYPLAWTTIAYLVWDDVKPDALTNLQQQALLDWLHWGGQLVISGPSSLDTLKGSYLSPYLPGEVAKTIKLEEPAFDELNRTFSLQRDPVRMAAAGVEAKGEILRRITIPPELPMLGVELEKHPEAREIEGTGGLVVERRVGGGRVVVTRFPLTDVRIKQWKNFDGFFNTVLLRRPAREFTQDNYLARMQVKWTEPQIAAMIYEARLGSTLRYFSRDIGFLDPDRKPPPPLPPTSAAAGMAGGPGMPGPGMARMGMYAPELEQPRDFSGTHPEIDDWHFCGYHSSPQSGVAGWNDDGSVSEAARLALTEAAGIEIPRADFVMQVLALYLLILVPVNWFVFWMIGRVEWAWIAAPLIAIVGAAAVIRLAQLDIGFARSRTEIAVLEVQGGYERAHLTRYTALYTSLSSNYTAAFSDSNSLALPFAAVRRNDSLLSMVNYNDVSFRRDSRESALAGVQVSSNSTGMIHSEQMLPLGDNPKITESLALVGDASKGYSVRNDTDLDLRDVGVLRRVDVPGSEGEPHEFEPRIETAYVARLEAGRSAPLKFEPLPETIAQSGARSRVLAGTIAARAYPQVWLPEWDQAGSFSQGGGKSRVRLTSLARLASSQLRLLPGDVRLVAWTDQALPGMAMRPEAPQNNTHTLVLAHLVRGGLPTVKPDKNVAEDYVDPAYLEPETDADFATAEAMEAAKAAKAADGDADADKKATAPKP